MKHAPLVLIGGGLWALSTAYYLARRGRAEDVLLLERGPRLAGETTSQSAGQVGQLRGDALLIEAIGDTLALLRGFREETGFDPGFVQSGSLHLALCEERAAMFADLAAVARDCGLAVESADASAFASRASGVHWDDVVSGLYVPGDGYVDAPAWAAALAGAVQAAGVKIQTECEVQSLVREGNRLVGVETTQGRIGGDHFVLAAGPWTRRLAATAEIAVPAYPIRLQQARTVACGVSPDHPVVRAPDTSCYIRPESGGYLYGFFDPEPTPIDFPEGGPAPTTAEVLPEETLVAESQRRLRGVLPALSELAIAQYRQGMITCTPDGKFVLGPADEVENLVLGCGCGGTGVAASGAIGDWLARWAVGESPTVDLSRYAVGRFGDRARDRDWLRAAACETSAAYYRLPGAVSGPN